MVYAEFGGQTECIMGNWKIENIIRVLGMGMAKALFSCLKLFFYVSHNLVTVSLV